MCVNLFLVKHLNVILRNIWLQVLSPKRIIVNNSTARLCSAPLSFLSNLIWYGITMENRNEEERDNVNKKKKNKIVITIDWRKACFKYANILSYPLIRQSSKSGYIS